MVVIARKIYVYNEGGRERKREGEKERNKETKKERLETDCVLKLKDLKKGQHSEV